MSNLSKASFFDAGKNPPRTRVVNVGGTKRVEKIPQGKVELWVNGQGNSVWQVIVPGGVPSSVNLIDERRATIQRRPGKWFRRHMCPLSEGELKISDFPERLRQPCIDHTKGLCPHAKHAIEERQSTHKAATELRHATMRKRETERKAREADQLAATQALNANINRLADLAAGKVEPASTEPPDKPKGKAKTQET